MARESVTGLLALAGSLVPSLSISKQARGGSLLAGARRVELQERAHQI